MSIDAQRERLVVVLARVAEPLFGDFAPQLDDVRGITLHVSDSSRGQLPVAGREIPETEIVRAPGADHCGPTVGVRWLDRDLTDYTSGFTG